MRCEVALSLQHLLERAHEEAVLFGFVCLSLRERENRKQDGQSERQLYPQMLM